MPSNLRKQWQVELEEKFDIDSLIVDSSNWEDYLEEVKSKQAVIIVSYHFASKRKTEFGKIALSCRSFVYLMKHIGLGMFIRMVQRWLTHYMN